MRRLMMFFALLCAMVLPLRAQEAAKEDLPALLVADHVFVSGDNTLIAEGNVEVLRDGIRLSATRIVYNSDDDSLVIEGPIRITQPDGTVVLADRAELDAGFENGILSGARVVLDEQLQIAAVEGRRAEGRYTQLSKVAVTSCQICGPQGVPLWQIRAARVIHDQQEKQLYFEDAQLRVLDVPVFFLPRLRLPDPTLKRARGFLIPELKSSTLLGFGIKLPYFIPIGDHADLTLTPYLSTVTKTLEFRYRQAFRKGDLKVTGAFGKDTIKDDGLRGYLFAEGGFVLPRGYTLSFDIEAVTDDSYLSDYSSNDNDRLDSSVKLQKVSRDTLIEAALYHFESLRVTEDNATQPTIVGDLSYARRFLPRFGGEFRVGASAHSHYRYSDLDIDGPDADTIVDGRDVARLSADLAYLNRWTLPGGLRAGFETHLFTDSYDTRQDRSMTRSVTEVTPAARAELRWPLVKSAAGGAKVLLEPIAQLAWVGGERGRVPNDESTRVEFDEGNLLSLSRFPAGDRRERGATGALGLRWLREDPRGWSAGLTLGRIWRDDADGDFSRSSGLTGTSSDWLVAGELALPGGLSLMARGLINDSFGLSKAEAQAHWDKGRVELDANYLLLVSDVAEGRSSALSEWNFAGSYDISPDWTASASWRYDLTANQFAKAGLGLNYQNECVSVRFSASRRFASSTNVEPSTNYGLTIALKGFSTGGSAKEYRRSCH
ncbi:MAG: LPS-assembly protein LptD [Roseivivax sp.]|nr:LPS-assembly protein LptD [Roseivivax sp.]